MCAKLNNEYRNDILGKEAMDSDDNMFLNGNLGMYLKIVFIGADAVTLIILLLPYVLMDEVKGTIVGKLMKSYCVLSMVALLSIFVYTLMEHAVSVSRGVCTVPLYIAYYALLASIISKVLFVFHIMYLSYRSHRRVLKDVTNRLIIRLKINYVLTITVLPLIMILIIIIHDHVLFQVKTTEGDRCLFVGDVNVFTMRTVIIFVAGVHSLGVLIILLLMFLLFKAYKRHKAIGEDTKNLFEIAVGIVLAYCVAWIVYAFEPLYSDVAPLILFSTAAFENLVVISVFFYRYEVLTKLKMYFVKLKHRDYNVFIYC